MQLFIDRCGTIRCLYDEELNLQELGRLSIRRGSHVEPTREAQWYSDLSPAVAHVAEMQEPWLQMDLSPVRGPILGPFASRSEALGAEREWLEKYLLEIHL
ncbi:hypothetical protein Pan216_04050 [Planctomycetes bacterium Pan216]|uniref:Uncharacterized protein n=1 Tax=Kolteria novifilia TaxID=2527975 RepID=A0A518AXW9_9BACT|nr:hypothetical protein Pan216_04050 [Planctomycetes bacterium Pan216]